MARINNAKYVREYLKNNPYIFDALKKDVVNYSKLARAIIKDSKVNLDFDALLVACRRYKKESRLKKDAIQKILQGTYIDAKNGVGVVVVGNKELDNVAKKVESISLIKSKEKTTILLKENDIDCLLGFLEIQNVKKNLVALFFKSNEDIEKTPGVVSYITSLFGNHDINIVKMFSCNDETVIVINKKDVSKIVNVLNI